MQNLGTTIFLVVGLVLATTVEGWSKPGGGNSSNSGNGNGNGGQGSQGNSGKSKADRKAESKEGAKNFQALDDNASLRAVRSRQAVSLERILTEGRAKLRSKIIDVRLLRRTDNILVYEIKGLSRQGAVENAYFYALSGKPVVD